MIFPIHARTFITTLIPFPFKEYSIFLRPLRKKTGYSSPPILYFSSILSPPLRLNILIHYPNFARNFKHFLPQAAYIVCFRLSFLPSRRSLKPAISFLTAYLFHFHPAFPHPRHRPASPYFFSFYFCSYFIHIHRKAGFPPLRSLPFLSDTFHHANTIAREQPLIRPDSRIFSPL